ncbi:MAG: hypothetical protein V4478_02750 [Patescibacteria group bacterium]
MMPYAIFNRLSTNTLLLGKFLIFAFFIGTIVLPLHIARAANFICTKSTIGTTTADLEIGYITSSQTYKNAQFALMPVVKSSQVIHSEPPADGNTLQQSLYSYKGLTPGLPYRLIALDQYSNFLEEVPDCNFTTKAAGTTAATATTPTSPAPVQTATPSTATTTPTNTGGTIIPAGSTALNIPEVTVGAGGSGLIPCDGPECDLNSFLQLANNVMAFFFRTLLLPIFVVMVMYLGYSYLTANGNPAQHGKVASMAKHMVLGLLLMLCAWVIVRSVLSMIGYQDDLFFFGK